MRFWATLVALGLLASAALAQDVQLQQAGIFGYPMCSGVSPTGGNALLLDPTIQVQAPPGTVPWPLGCWKAATPPANWDTPPTTAGGAVVVSSDLQHIHDFGAPPGGGSGSGVLHKQLFITTANFTAPTGITSNTVFEIDLAGAGAGGGAGASGGSMGTGGGAGARCRAVISGLVAGTAYPITLGSAGIGGTAGGNGANGGDTMAAFGATTYTAGGGKGGVGSVASGSGNVGGAGGTPSTACDATSLPGGDGNPGVWNYSANIGTVSGRGGDTPGWGAGGAGIPAGVSGAGKPGKGYGSGGSGGMAGAPSDGGAGAPAIAVIKWVQ